MAHNGFSVLAWVKTDSALLWDVTTEEAKEKIVEQLLKDFNCLIGCRWNMDMHLTTIDGHRYAYGINTRITASDKTISNAIGELSNHVGFLRGTANNSAEELANYKVCKEKWKVPEDVSTSSYGWAQQEQAETSALTKRKRFF